MNNKFQLACSLAEEIYFNVIDLLDIKNKCVENDTENKGCTKNTELGQNLYWSIEEILQDKLNKENKK